MDEQLSGGKRAAEAWTRTVSGDLPGRHFATHLIGVTRDGVVGLAFWLAVFLPVAYLPVLATDVLTTGEATLLIALLAVHATALVVGHEHGR